MCCPLSTQTQNSRVKHLKNTKQLSLFLSAAKKNTVTARVVSVGQLGLTAASTAGTATVVLGKSFFRSFFLVLSREVLQKT